MGFKLGERYEELIKEQYAKQYILLPDGSEKHVTEYADRSVEHAEHKELRMNSYARDKFISKMTDDLLIQQTKYYLTHCGRYNYPSSTYDETVVHVIVPELIKRLESSMLTEYFNDNKDMEQFWNEHYKEYLESEADKDMLLKIAKEDVMLLIKQLKELKEEYSFLHNENWVQKERLGMNEYEGELGDPFSFDN